VSASLAMPKSTSQAVTVALNDERRSAPSKLMKGKSYEIHTSGGERHESSKAVRLLAKKATKRKSELSPENEWSHPDSSRLFEDGFKEDRHRQSEFHQELLRVRQAVAAAQLRRRKELAKQHLVFKLRAMQTARHLDNGGLYSEFDKKKYTAISARKGNPEKVHSGYGIRNGLARQSTRDGPEHSFSIHENSLSAHAEHVLHARRKK
jgi:hypothetical protein